MRLNRGLFTGVVVCLTVLFVLFNSRSTVEVAEDLESDLDKRLAGKWEIHKGQTYRYVTPSLAELGAHGIQPKTNKHVLMLTRVPDAGAELLVLLLQRLQGYNAFKHIRLPPGDNELLSTLQQELLVEEVTNIIRQEAIPLTFDGDVRFLNFSKFGRQAPTFISLVRNPIDVRNLQRFHSKQKTVFENRAIPMFCGQDPRCTKIHSQWALQRAKANIVEWYPVVALLDYMEQSIDVLEQKFPYFFRGAGQIYSKIRPNKRSSNYTITLKPRERDVLFKYLEDEIELYQWLKFRLLNETRVEGEKSKHLRNRLP